MTELLVFLAGVTVGISLTAMMYVFWVIPKARKVFMEIVEVAERQKAGHTYRDTEDRPHA